THPNGDIAYTQTGETGFLQKAAEPLGGWLAGGQAALRHAGPLGREGIQHRPTADRCHGGKAPDDKAIAAAGDERPLEEQTRDAGFARCDRSYLGDSSQDLRRAEVNPNARTDRERLLGRWQQLERDVEGAGRGPSRARHGDMAAIDFLLGNAHERECRASSRPGLIRVVTVHLDRAHADVAVQRQQPHACAGGYGTAPRRARDYSPRSWQREHAIDRQPE